MFLESAVTIYNQITLPKLLLYTNFGAIAFSLLSNFNLFLFKAKSNEQMPSK